MASLKEIMNIEDESHGSDSIKRSRESVPRSSAAPGTTSSASHFGSAPDHSFVSSSAQGQRNSPSALQQHPYTSETASSSPGASTESRRRSNTSNDSMDAAYYASGHGYAAMSASSGPSRAYMPSGGPGGEAPVKLTPITGRVSRAKKGVPVHVCEHCRPPKTFTRAEHLRRHQLSHQPPDLACSVPGCDKVFHRRDLLERHQLRHEQEVRGGLDPGSGSGSGSPFSGGPPSSQGYPMTAPLPGAPHSSGMDLGMGDTGVDMGSAAWSAMGENQNLTGSSHMPPSHGDVPGGYRMANVYAGSSSSDLSGQGYLSSGSSSHWKTSPGVAPSSSTTNGGIGGSFSTASYPRTTGPSGWTDQGAPFSMSQRGIQSPLMDSSPDFYTYTTSPTQGESSTSYGSTMGLSLNGFAEAGPLHSSDQLLNNPVRSLSPPLAVAQSSETLVTMPTAVPSERIATHFAYRGVEDPLSPLAAQLSTALSLDREIRTAIPAYIDVYWDKFQPTFPIVHKPTFDGTSEVVSEEVDLLRCSMAAVATQFLEGKEHRINGNALHAHVWNCARVYTQADEWSLPVMQAVLLAEYYARFRGRKKESHRPSSRFAKLYQMVIDHQNTFAPIPTNGDSSSSWKQWIAMESRRRILSSCFLLDVHSMMYYEQPLIMIMNLDYSSPSTLPIPLSAGSTKLWEAPTHQAWGQLAGTAPPVETITTALSKSPTEESIASAPPFDAAILLGAYALYLPRRKDATKVEASVDLRFGNPESYLATLFSQSGIANTYAALHHTPLHVLLSVSGESWVFNKKILKATMYTEHRQYLDAWSRSDTATVAVTFAARALKAFLGVNPSILDDGGSSFVEQQRGVPWKDISDFWGVYVCALICWAYGQGSNENQKEANDASRRTGLQWILSAAEMEATELKSWARGRSTLAVVCLVRDILARDCVTGRSILMSDSLNVLKKLGGRDGWDWP